MGLIVGMNLINGAVKYIYKAVYDAPPIIIFKGYAFHSNIYQGEHI